MPISRHLLPKTLRVEDRGIVWSRSEFVLLIDYFHHWLDVRGVGRGDIVILSTNNSVGVYALFFALMERGAIFYGTHMRAFYNIPRYREADAKLVMVDDETCFRELGETGLFPDAELMPVMDKSVIENVEPVTSLAHIGEDDRCIIAATSGTTGEPTVIAHTHRSILTPTEIAKDLLFKPEDRALCYLNLNHLGFLTVFTLAVFFKGCTVVIATSDDIEDGLPLLTEKKITKMLCFPWLLTQMIQTSEADGRTVDLSGIEIVTGGQTISPLFLTKCFGFGAVAVHNAYGMTEVPPPTLLKSNYAATFDPVTYDPLYLGEPVGDVEVMVHQSGRIALRTPGVGMHLDGTPLTEDCGFVLTGDRGVKLDGRYYNAGRLIVFKRDGERIMVNDTVSAIEELIRREPLGQYFCPIVLRRPEWEDPILVVMLAAIIAKRHDLSLERINAHVTERLDRFHYLDMLMIVEELPNNGLKVDGLKAKAVADEAIDRYLEGEEVKGLYIRS